jgi:hypothetical protein
MIVMAGFDTAWRHSGYVHRNPQPATMTLWHRHVGAAGAGTGWSPTTSCEPRTLRDPGSSPTGSARTRHELRIIEGLAYQLRHVSTVSCARERTSAPRESDATSGGGGDRFAELDDPDRSVSSNRVMVATE